jgi:hypothetical protein
MKTRPKPTWLTGQWQTREDLKKERADWKVSLGRQRNISEGRGTIHSCHNIAHVTPSSTAGPPGHISLVHYPGPKDKAVNMGPQTESDMSSARQKKKQQRVMSPGWLDQVP